MIAPNIAGGSITALEKMEATCDFYVGNNIYLGGSTETGKSIIFRSGASISNPENTDGLELNAAGTIALRTAYKLDLSGAAEIVWGNNAPHAVFA